MCELMNLQMITAPPTTLLPPDVEFKSQTSGVATIPSAFSEILTLSVCEPNQNQMVVANN